jgi:hypothetical protein
MNLHPKVNKLTENPLWFYVYGLHMLFHLYVWIFFVKFVVFTVVRIKFAALLVMALCSSIDPYVSTYLHDISFKKGARSSVRGIIFDEMYLCKIINFLK